MHEVADMTVVVCSYAGDDVALTLECLRRAAEQAPVLLVDMSPDDRITSRATRLAGVRVEHVPGSSGLGESRQRGTALAGGRFVAFLDSDAFPRTGWARALRRALDVPDVAVAGGPVLPVWPDGARIPRLFHTAPASDFLSMLDLGPTAMDVPRVLPGNMAVDLEVGGGQLFSERLGRRGEDLYGAEEIEFMERARGRGLRIVYEPAAAVDHHTRADRMNWRWMWRRVEAAGRESRLTSTRLPPLPRSLRAADRLFQVVVTPAFVAGRRRRGPTA